MMARQAGLRQVHLTRILKALKEVGIKFGRLEVDTVTGRVIVLSDQAARASSSPLKDYEATRGSR